MSNTLIKVKIFDSQGTQVLNLGKSAVTIGSAAHCDVVLDHPSVQAEHARAWLEGGRIWVQDLGGTSGTTLNGVRLPPLKPLLVRELDSLKMGECESSLGLEMNFVRSPTVKTSITAVKQMSGESGTKSAITKAPQKSEPVKAAASKAAVSHSDSAPPPVERTGEVKQRQEELASVALELADLKRQLQMAKLEFTSGQEIFAKVDSLRTEVQRAETQSERAGEKVRQLEGELKKVRQDKELGSRNLLSQIQTEKRESLAVFAKHIRSVSSKLLKRWVTRPLSQDMVFEWENETLGVYREVALQGVEGVPPLPALPPLPNVESAASRADDLDHAETVVRALPRAGESEAPVSAEIKPRTRKRRKSDRVSPLRRLTFAVLGFATVLTAMWLGLNWFRQHGMATLSSLNEPEVKEHKKRAPARYAPKQNRKYRGSYTDNVLFFESYSDIEQNPDFRGLWRTDLSKVAVAEWQLDAASIKSLLGKEEKLIEDLMRIRNGIMTDRTEEGIAQLKARESQFQSEVGAMLKNKATYARFFKLKTAFFERNQAYLKRESL